MSKTHWKKLFNPNYLGVYALDEGKDLIATIQTVRKENVIGSDGKKEECMIAHFQEAHIKPMIVNATNAKTITKLYKTPFIEDWAGRRIQIYAATIQAFGETVQALRIRSYVPKVAVKKQMVCVDCGAPIRAFKAMDAAKMAQYTSDKYGKCLCADCATKAAEDKRNIENEAKELSGALDKVIDQLEVSI